MTTPASKPTAQRGQHNSYRHGVSARRRAIFAAAVLSALGGASSAFAADLYWDTNGNTAGSSAGTTAAGTWNAGNTNWSTDSSGLSATSAWIDDGTSTAVFAAGTNATGAYTVATSGTLQVGGVTVEEGTVTIGTTGTLNLTGTTNLFNVASGASLSNNSGALLTGASTVVMTKTGLGSFTLGAANVGYNGKIAITGGMIITGGQTNGSNMGANPTAQRPDHLTLDGGTIRFTNTTALTMLNRGITIGASGGTINFFGTTGINAGGINMGLTPLTGTANITLTGPTLPLSANPNGGNISTMADNTTTFFGKWIVNGGEVNPQRADTTDNGFGAIPTDVSSDYITLNGGNVRGSANFSVHANRGITLGASGGGLHQITGGTMTVNSVIAGAGPLRIVTDTGASSPAITLAAANTYTGDTLINNFNASGTGVVNLSGSLASTNVSVNTTGIATTAATFNITSTGALASATNLSTASNVTVNFANASQSLASLSGGGIVNLNGPTALTVGSGSFGGVIAGTGSSLTKDTSGTLTLGGANTYDGTTTISGGGILRVNGSIASTAAIDVSGSGSTLAGTGSVAGTVTVNPAARISAGIGGANAVLTVPSLIIKAGSNLDFTLGAAGSPFGVSDQLNVLNAGGLDITDGAATVNLAATASGTYHLIKYNSSYTGTLSNLVPNVAPGFDAASLTDNVGDGYIDVSLTVTDRTWNVNADGNWSTGSNWTSPASQPNGPGAHANLLGAILVPHTVTIDNADKTVGVLNLDNANAYTIAASGANKLILDTYGPNATLAAINGSHSISAPIQLNKTVDVSVTNVSDTLTIGNVSGTGGLNKSGAGAVLITGNLGNSGALSHSGSGSLSIAGTVNNGGGITHSATGTLSISGSISGAGNLNSSAGAVVLSASNSYSGGTTVAGGTLTAAAASALGSGNVVVTGATTTLDIGGNNQSVGAVTLTDGLITGTSGVLSGTSFSSTNGTFAANLGGTGTMTKPNSGVSTAVVTVSGSNSFTGGTVVNGLGYFVITSDAALGAAPTTPTINLTIIKSPNAPGAQIPFFVFDGDMTINANRLIKLQQSNGGGPNLMASAGKTVTINSDIIGAGGGTNLRFTDEVAVPTHTGTINLRGNNTSGPNLSLGGGLLTTTFINIGTVNVIDDLNFAPGNVQLNGSASHAFTGTLQFGASFAWSSTRGLLFGGTGGNIDTNGFNQTVGGVVSGAGQMTKIGAGTLTLTGANTHTGPMTITAGTVSVAADNNIGDVASLVTFNGGTLQTTAGFTTGRAIAVNAPGGTFDTTGQAVLLNSGGNSTWIGNLTVGGGGSLSFDRGGGTVAVTPGASITVNPGTTLNVSGLEVLSDGTDHTNIINNSTTSFNVTGGTHNAGNITGVGNSSASGGSTLNANLVRQNALSIADTSKVKIRTTLNPLDNPDVPTPGTGAGASVLNSLPTVASGASFDLNDSKLIVQFGTNASPVVAARAAIILGRGGTDFGTATWQGTGGIASDAAAVGGTGDNGVNPGDGISFAIGYVENSFLPALGLSSYTEFGGQTVDSGSLLIRFTRGADCNLDGKVNTDDVTIVGATFGTTNAEWSFGDFDYDGVVDSDDVTVLGALYDATAPALSQAQLTAQFGSEFAAAFARGQALGSAVPEPTSLSLLGLGGIGLLKRRRRSRA